MSEKSDDDTRGMIASPGRRKTDHEPLSYIALVAAGLALVLVCIVALGSLGNRGELERVVGELQRQQGRDTQLQDQLVGDAEAQCIRVQILRETVNRFGAALYTSTQVAARLAPTAGDRTGFRARARSLMYVPPTDCREAVKNPRTYRLPEPVSFSELTRVDLRRIQLTGR